MLLLLGLNLDGLASGAYWIAHPDSTWPGTPTGAQIAAGKLSNNNNAAYAGSESAPTSGSGTITEATAITGLTGGTSYRIAWVVYDSVSDTYSNVVVGTESTLAGTTSATITPAAGAATAGTLAGSATAAATITAATGTATTNTLAASSTAASTITAAAGTATTSTLVGTGLTAGASAITPAAGAATTSTLTGSATAAATISAATGSTTVSTLTGSATAAASITPAAGVATGQTLVPASSVSSASMTPAAGSTTAATFAASAVAASVVIAAAGASSAQTLAASAMAQSAITPAAGVATGLTLSPPGTTLDLILKILSNRQELNASTGTFTIYDNDSVTVLYTANAWADAAGTIPYSGGTLARIDALV